MAILDSGLLLSHPLHWCCECRGSNKFIRVICEFVQPYLLPATNPICLYHDV